MVLSVMACQMDDSVTMTIRLSVLTLSTLVALAPSVAPAQGVAPVPLHFVVDTNDMIRVPVTVGDSSYSLIFDTGAGIDVLQPRLVAALHGVPVGWLDAFRMTGERLHLQLFRIPRLAVGTFQRRDVIVTAAEFLEQAGIPGILSLNGFRDRAVTIDLVRNELTVETTPSLTGRRRGTVVPLYVGDLRGLSLDTFAEFRLGSERGQCSLDTGSQGPTLSTRILSPLGIDTTGPDVRVRRSTTVTGAAQIRYIARIPAIALAADSGIRQVTPTVTFSDIIYDCVIGLDYWKGRVLTIDVPRRRLIVSLP